jgi:hypothetical protein
MGEIIRFVSRSEQERSRLIERARAIYESVFPSLDPQRWVPVVQPARVTNVRRIEERLPR